MHAYERCHDEYDRSGRTSRKYIYYADYKACGSGGLVVVVKGIQDSTEAPEKFFRPRMQWFSLNTCHSSADRYNDYYQSPNRWYKNILQTNPPFCFFFMLRAYVSRTLTALPFSAFNTTNILRHNTTQSTHHRRSKEYSRVFCSVPNLALSWPFEWWIRKIDIGVILTRVIVDASTLIESMIN